MLALIFLAAQAAEPRSVERGFVMPPRAAEVSGAIAQAQLAPIFRQNFMCSEHFEGQIPFAGDALGSDCYVMGGVDGDEGFSRAYRTDGSSNADWYGWRAEVLAPVDGIVVGLIENDKENVPGVLGKPPAGMIQIERADGVLITLAHITEPLVKVGAKLVAGQTIARVGNNGFGRAPHIHVGAYRRATAEPLQIRWDLRAMARLQQAATE